MSTLSSPLAPPTASPMPHWADLLHAPAGVHVHLVGIGGAGLSAIAELLLQRGVAVSGSDQRASASTAALTDAGAEVFIGHAAAHIQGADLVLISSAVPADNPEVQAAHAAGIPVVKREHFIGPLMQGYQSLCVAGTHGKTTTSAMLAALLDAMGAEPSFLVGSTVLALGAAARSGRAGGPFVIEADEYDHMFWGLRPDVAVITNVDWDHVDCYPNPDDFRQAFVHFAKQTRPGGVVLINGDDPGSRAVARDLSHAAWQTTSFGFGPDNTWRAAAISPVPGGGSDFEVWRGDRLLGRVSMALSGQHNVRNALAALAAAHAAGYDVFSEGYENLKFSRIFAGTKRRLEIIGQSNDIIVLDDYAHHPTEVRATLEAVRHRFPRRTVWALFQPHTYTRTKALLNEFRASFENADHVLVTDIYAARERDTLGISAQTLVDVAAGHGDVRYGGSLAEASAALLAELRPGDVLITLGAGDGDRVGRQVLAELRSRAAHAAPSSSLEDRYQALATAIAQETGLAVRRDEMLAAHTTLRIGGPADVFVAVAALDDLITVWQLAHEMDVPTLLLGGGSNLLASDAGVRGLVISNGCRAVQRREGHVVWAESGAHLAGLARQTMRWGLSGLEWGVSVPGAVGGAVVGNAGAHGGCIADNLLRVTLLGPDGARSEWPARRLDYSYRRSRLKTAIQHGQAAPVVLAASFQLQPGDSTKMEARAAAFLAHRRGTQPVEPSAGSVFQNPPGDYAGRIIEALGLKGAVHGGAAFSTVHANFIVNCGGATAADVLTLVNTARRRAWEALSVTLQPEILFVGEWAAEPLLPLSTQTAEPPTHEASL